MRDDIHPPLRTSVEIRRIVRLLFRSSWDLCLPQRASFVCLGISLLLNGTVLGVLVMLSRLVSPAPAAMVFYMGMPIFFGGSLVFLMRICQMLYVMESLEEPRIRAHPGGNQDEQP